jgi:(p)ppGpp synthase/HD superfamily hydrolase
MGTGANTLPAFLHERPRTRAAFEVAAGAHGDQERAGDEALYIVHPLEVAATLDALGFDDDVTAAALLHDVLEQTDLDGDELERRFGARVAGLVATLTDDESIEDDRERKAMLRRQVAESDRDAAAIFAADKVSKVRELRILLTRRPEDAGDPEVTVRLEHYRESLGMLESRLGEHALVRLLRFELEALQALPPYQHLTH